MEKCIELFLRKFDPGAHKKGQHYMPRPMRNQIFILMVLLLFLKQSTLNMDTFVEEACQLLTFKKI